MKTAVINKCFPDFPTSSSFTFAEVPAACEEGNASKGCTWEFIDENELAGELTDALSSSYPGSTPPEIAPEDFEEIYRWFLS